MSSHLYFPTGDKRLHRDLRTIRILVVFLVNTELRRPEAIGLTMAGIDFERRLLQVTRTKSKRVRIISSNCFFPFSVNASSSVSSGLMRVVASMSHAGASRMPTQDLVVAVIDHAKEPALSPLRQGTRSQCSPGSTSFHSLVFIQ